MPGKKTPHENKNAVIYARYSSHSQRDASIEQQVAACRRFAQESGLQVVEIYADHAMTGTNDNRPEFQRMLRESAAGGFAYVIVYTLDRFSRDRYDSAVHKHTLKSHGVRVLSAMEQLRDDPTGVLMESVLEGLAEYYSKELAQKIRRGMMSNAEKCMVLSNLPLGYRKGADGRFEVDEAEAAIVREIFTRVAAGDVFADIFRCLNERGIRTKRGAAWNRSSLCSLLHNEKYIGVYEYGDYRNEQGIPPIIDRALFARVQEVCREKPNARGNPMKRRREGGTYLLTGKLYCGECKGPMIGVSGTGRNGEPHYYYVCKNRREKKSCHKRHVSRDFAEDLVAAELYRFIAQPDVRAWFADQAIQYQQQHRDTEEMDLLRQRLEQIRREKENTLRAIRAGITHASVQAMLEDLSAQEDAAAAKLAIAEERSRTEFTREDFLALFDVFLSPDFTSGDLTSPGFTSDAPLSKRFQELLFDAFLVRAYLYDDHLTLVFTYNPDGVDIPFNVDTAEAEASASLDLPDLPADSYKVCNAPLLSPYTNPSTVYFLRGLFVQVTRLAGL